MILGPGEIKRKFTGAICLGKLAEKLGFLRVFASDCMQCRGDFGPIVVASQQFRHGMTKRAPRSAPHSRVHAV
jgi:hypothetical protein